MNPRTVDSCTVIASRPAAAPLTARASGSSVTLTDGAGNTINVVSADMPASNGVIHGVDRVAMPG